MFLKPQFLQRYSEDHLHLTMLCKNGVTYGKGLLLSWTRGGTPQLVGISMIEYVICNILFFMIYFVAQVSLILKKKKKRIQATAMLFLLAGDTK